jgi:hypothetical protein
MSNGTDAYQLETIADDHPLAVQMFVPFTIARLRPSTEVNEVVLAVRTQMAGEASPTQNALRLSWLAASALHLPFAVQEHVVTEWAALGVACVVLARYTPPSASSCHRPRGPIRLLGERRPARLRP